MEYYNYNNRLGQYLKYIAKIKKDVEFQSNEAWRIDPLTTVFTLRYLLLYRSCQSCKKLFGENIEDILKKGLITLGHLYEGYIPRNKEMLTPNSQELQQFDGTEYPLFDGGWMNAELPIERDYALPDYSICSSIDVLIALNSIRWILNVKNDEIEKILSDGCDYIRGRLNDAINKKMLNSCIDASHWDDRQSSNCAWSDIYCVCKKVDFLLDYCLFKIIHQPKGNTATSKLSKILGTDIISNSIIWLIKQQQPKGFWPKTSESLLIEASARQKTQINRLLSPYLVDLNIEIPSTANAVKQKLKSINEEKILSFGNTFQCVNVLAKYLIVQSIFEYTRYR
jgi:hypothetical protein